MLQSRVYAVASRLTAIEDALGNRIEYAVDAGSNVYREDVKDPAGAVPADVALTYDALGRLTGFLDAHPPFARARTFLAK